MFVDACQRARNTRDINKEASLGVRVPRCFQKREREIEEVLVQHGTLFLFFDLGNRNRNQNHAFSKDPALRLPGTGLLWCAQVYEQMVAMDDFLTFKKLMVKRNVQRGVLGSHFFEF